MGSPGKIKTAIIFLGKNGSGKGTQVNLVSQKYGIPCMTTSTVLDNCPEKRQGILVNDDLVNRVVANYVGQLESDIYIADGYPRTAKQADFIETVLMTRRPIVIQIEISDEAVIQRSSFRRVCANTECNWPTTADFTVCEKCGSHVKIRDDDALEIVERRLELYHRNIKAVRNHPLIVPYLTVINGDRSVNEVLSDVCQVIEDGFAARGINFNPDQKILYTKSLLGKAIHLSSNQPI